MQMHGTVRELESNMDQLSVSQQYANHGIYVLCKVLLLPGCRAPCARMLSPCSCAEAASLNEFTMARGPSGVCIAKRWCTADS